MVFSMQNGYTANGIFLRPVLQSKTISFMWKMVETDWIYHQESSRRTKQVGIAEGLAVVELDSEAALA